MRRSTYAAALVTCTLAAAPALAQEPGFYLGAGIADSNVQLTEGGCDDYWCDEWSRDGRSDGGYTITAGWRVNRWFALEAGYLDAGTPGWDDFGVYVPSLGGIRDVEADVDFRATELAALAVLPLGRTFDVYAKLGVARYEATSRQRAKDRRSGSSSVRTLEDSGTEPTLGVGAGVTIAERLRARLEVRGMRVDPELLIAPGGEATLLTFDLQLQYRF
jgi:hypothetical protein